MVGLCRIYVIGWFYVVQGKFARRSHEAVSNELQIINFFYKNVPSYIRDVVASMQCETKFRSIDSYVPNPVQNYKHWDSAYVRQVTSYQRIRIRDSDRYQNLILCSVARC